MHPQLTRVQQLDDLDRLIAESDERPVLLFKHSRSCGISAEALDGRAVWSASHFHVNAAEIRQAMATTGS